MQFKFLGSAAATILAASSLAAAAPTSELSLTTQLRLADTALDRYKLLKDSDFLYDFGKQPSPIANSQTFPALVGSGISMSVAQLEGCGMAALHIHPRSAEVFTVLNGTLYTEMVPESGAVDAAGKQRVIKLTLTPKTMTVFPMGSLHMQMNPGWEPVQFVAAFTTEDPGAGLIAPETFALDDGFIVTSFGGAIAEKDIARIRTAVPQGPFIRVEECRKKRGLEN